ncbi:DUF2786 domain-containing protein [Thermopolyspora sp. NPDC052614]|uniref:DUF2786 domain-containing protein n=1 Tax=Thermopolyspora sp. NPDC052614 TaxID=3155682 RepID=UPI003426AFA5
MASTETPERILIRIRKLLAVAEHPNTSETEAETYMAQAMALMAKYGVERALLADEGRAADVVDVSEIELRAPYKVEKSMLLNVIAMALRCRVVTSRRFCEADGRYYQIARVLGFGADRERVTMLFASLVVQMFAALARTPVPYGVAAVTFRKAFCHGYTVRIRERLTAAERHAAKEAGVTSPGRSAELILRDREHQVDAEFARRFPTARRGRSYRRSLQGAADGAAAANLADLGGTRLSGDDRRVLTRGG